ncbi:hypothetical protein CDAR_584101 [Caerostris darwini]|uniref:Uncharacterized protein n=1 Tax=Caerostris darwini TaxID=1538125 RepID=A0AAV4W9U7_9ARAC|nr:hypothetical protein CDAR_584101 [Caerostris darwini]
MTSRQSQLKKASLLPCPAPWKHPEGRNEALKHALKMIPLMGLTFALSTVSPERVFILTDSQYFLIVYFFFQPVGFDFVSGLHLRFPAGDSTLGSLYAGCLATCF